MALDGNIWVSAETGERVCLTLVLALLILERALGRPKICHALPIRRLQRLDLQPCIGDSRPRILHGNGERALIKADHSFSPTHGLDSVYSEFDHPPGDVRADRHLSGAN